MIDEIMNAYRKGVEVIKSLGKQANEDHTINLIIKPILNILGWSMFNKTLMTKYSVKGYKGMQEVDIALFVNGFESDPTVLIEVKFFGTKFSDLFIKQLESYGTLIKKAKWLVYTNGAQWKIISNDKKETVLEFDLESGIDDRFELLSFDSVTSGKLQKYTFRSMAEKAVEKYIAEFQDKLAEDIYQFFEKKYPKDEIEEALKRLKAGFTQHYVEPKTEPEKVSKVSKSSKFPIPIYAVYKGERYDAELLDDGEVIYAGEKCASPSGAARMVVKSKRGPNGWTFWKLAENDKLIKTIRNMVKRSETISGESILDRLNEEQTKLIDFVKEKAQQIAPEIETWARKNYFAIGFRTKRYGPLMLAAFNRRKNGLRVEVRYPFEKLDNPFPILKLPPHPESYVEWKGEITVAHIETIDDIEKIFPVLKKAYEFLKGKYDRES